MTPILNSKEMKAADDYTIRHFMVDGLVLMERAALSVVDYIDEKAIDATNVIVVCGVGNNGGDGLAVARLLLLKGIAVKAIIVGDKAKFTDSCKRQYETFLAYGGRVSSAISDLDDATLIIDALFGVGLTRSVEGSYKEVIEYINKCKAYKLAVDIPSGLSADDGAILGAAVMATATITFGFAKIGHFLKEGIKYCGELKICDIGISRHSLSEVTFKCASIDEAELSLLKEADFDAHKKSKGRVLVIAGSENMSGAAYLCSAAAYRSGAGIVTLLTDKAVKSVIASRLPEAIIGEYNNISEDELKSYLSDTDCVVIGPGLSKGSVQRNLLRLVMNNLSSPIVIDADALNIIAEDLSLLDNLKEEVLLTPHIGEMSRLLGEPTGFVSENILKCARDFANEKSVTVLLKSHRSVVAVPFSRTYINTIQSSNLATAGSGDVLAGICAGLTARGIDIKLSGAIGSYIHGCCGVKAGNGAIASDLINEIKEVINLELKRNQ